MKSIACAVAAVLFFGRECVALKLQQGSETTPDTQERVDEEANENIQIHEVFQSKEDQDDHDAALLKVGKTAGFLQQGKWAVALDRDMKTRMLIQTAGRASKAPEIKDPCGGISCGGLACPAGFAVTEVSGHCCPYCVNPDIKVEDAVTGATGESGGKASTFCPDVWCFPTMCTKGVSNPSDANGQCCPVCPAL